MTRDELCSLILLAGAIDVSDDPTVKREFVRYVDSTTKSYGFYVIVQHDNCIVMWDEKDVFEHKYTHREGDMSFDQTWAFVQHRLTTTPPQPESN